MNTTFLKKYRDSRVPDWLVPAGLVLLSVIPIVAGTGRLIELASGSVVTEENARFVAAPLPVILHIISVTLYALLGAFQFAPHLRKRKHPWHRRVGWVIAPAGMLAALSGMWMAHFYDLPPLDGRFLYAMRMMVGLAMLVAIVLAVIEVRRRDYRRHGAWMTRAYALGMGAGTQAFTHIPWIVLFGVPGLAARTCLMAAGWVINILIAEWAIARRHTPPKPIPQGVVTSS